MQSFVQKRAWLISQDSAQLSERGCKVVECATKYMGVMSQNALSLIIAPPSGGNSTTDYDIFCQA